jgi:hypothetical protein
VTRARRSASASEDQIQLAYQSRAQKYTFGTAASLQQQPPHAEFAIEDVQREGEIELRLSGEDVRYAVAAQPRQMRIRNCLGQNDNNRIATDVRTAPADLACASRTIPEAFVSRVAN